MLATEVRQSSWMVRGKKGNEMSDKDGETAEVRSKRDFDFQKGLVNLPAGQ